MNQFATFCSDKNAEFLSSFVLSKIEEGFATSSLGKTLSGFTQAFKNSSKQQQGVAGQHVTKLKQFIEELDDEHKKTVLNKAFMSVVDKLKGKFPRMMDQGLAEEVAAKFILDTFEDGFFRLTQYVAQKTPSFFIGDDGKPSVGQQAFAMGN